MLALIRGEIARLRSLEKGEGTEIMFPVLCRPFEEHPEYIVYYIDLFNLSTDFKEKEILAIIICQFCNYEPVIEFLTTMPVGGLTRSAFDDDVPLSEEELQRLLSLPEGERMSYDPADEAIVQKRAEEIEGKTLAEINAMYSKTKEDN